MANRRMLSKSISTSLQVNNLSCVEAKLLFTWMIPHTDDHGRIRGELIYIKAVVVPMTDWLLDTIQKYLNEMEEVELIHQWEERQKKFIHFPGWKSHQTIQKDRRKESKLPPCPICIENGWIQSGYPLDTNVEDNIKEANEREAKGNEREEKEEEYEEEP